MSELPNPLQTKQDYRNAMAALERIFEAAKPGTPEGDEFERLASQIEDWERRNSTKILLDAEKWEAFQEALAAPPRPMPRLLALPQEPSIFDSDLTAPRRISPEALADNASEAEEKFAGVFDALTQGPQIRLAPEDQEASVEAMLNPPPPSSALIRAAERLMAFETDQQQGDQGDQTPRRCPNCGASWLGELIPEASRKAFGGLTHFRRCVAVYDRESDRTTGWACPDCRLVFDRATARSKAFLAPEGDGND